uniref:Prolyl 4-hydroxylase alpha-subunit N-terminal domain-containing protein n=1 Tax=Clastoptera arizonana TaxID=38151 RepID=A0A1B6E4S1_9HEMI
MVFKATQCVLFPLVLFCGLSMVNLQRQIEIFKTNHTDMIDDINGYIEKGLVIFNTTRDLLKCKLTPLEKFMHLRERLQNDHMAIAVTAILLDYDNFNKTEKLYNDIKQLVKVSEGLIDYVPEESSIGNQLELAKKLLYKFRLVKLRLQRRGIIDKKFKL